MSGGLWGTVDSFSLTQRFLLSKIQPTCYPAGLPKSTINRGLPILGEFPLNQTPFFNGGGEFDGTRM
ncbi:hypothetical protein Pla100_54390 [Neorhodopirellula pilleata]|uniref:Uncharacterized protein n=1 Tax=Neorhodopirellula pilleata TaxID=2714738 RepID=A0A5C5ZQH7_9BACT|nr:hypothetical protein Pla100_54390 [Neorhodopirellula pilleata]